MLIGHHYSSTILNIIVLPVSECWHEWWGATAVLAVLVQLYQVLRYHYIIVSDAEDTLLLTGTRVWICVHSSIVSIRL